MLLALAGFATLRLLGQDVGMVVRHWAYELHLGQGGHHVAAVIDSLAGMTPRTLVSISAGMFFYAALLLTEGTGLLLRKRWAEYFTIVVTGSFVPLEVMELTRHVTAVRSAVTALNVAIVWYLAGRVWTRAGACRTNRC